MSTAKLFVTNDAKLAKLFNSKRELGFEKALATIFSTGDANIKNSIRTALLNFYNDYSRATFDSFEYTLGYGQGAGENNFKISLTLRDITGNLEQLFLNGFIDADIDLGQADPDQLIKLAQESLITGGIAPDTEFKRNQNSDENSKHQNSNILSVINRTYYFIFISDTGYYLSPIASNFFKATVTAATMGQAFKLIKLEFICTGHPFLLSELSEIGNYSTRGMHNNPNKDQTGQDYDITVNWSLQELEDSPEKLDANIKIVIRKLFQMVTGKPVIVLLPDFGKIYKRYKKNKTPSIKASMESDISNADVINSFGVQNVAKYWELKSFLNLLGFTFIPNFTAKFYEKLNQLSSKEKQNIENFRERYFAFASVAEKMIDDLVDGIIQRQIGPDDFETVPDNLFEFLDQLDEVSRRLPRDRQFSLDKESFFNALNSYIETIDFKNRLIRDNNPEFYSQLYQAINNRDLAAVGRLTNILNKEQKKDFLKSIIKISYLSRLDRIIRLGDEGYINYLIQSGKSVNDVEFTPEYDENNNKVTGIIRFRISSKDESSTQPAPLTNFVNFNVFANNFSNKLSYLSDQTYEITYTEENVVSRLETLTSACFYHDEKLNKIAFLSSPTQQAVVIYDSWFFNNLYAPVQGIPSEIDDELVSISELDKENFRHESPYHKASINDIGIKYYSSNGIVLPFTGYVKDVSKIKDDAQTISDEIINYFPAASSVFNQGSKAYEIPIFVWYPAGQDLLPSVNNIRRQTFGLNVSTPDTENIENLPNKLQSNLDYLNVDVNSLNQLAGYNSYINEVASIITDDALISSRFTIYTRLGINLESYEKTFDSFFAALASNQSNNPDSFLKGVTDSIAREVSGINIRDYAKLFEDSEESRLYDTSNTPVGSGGTTNLDTQIAAGLELESRFNNYKEQLKIRILKDLWYTALKTTEDGVVVNNLTRRFIGNPLVSKSNMLKHLYNKYYTIKITSIFPWYQLNNLKILNYPCLLLAFDAVKVNIKDVKSLIKPSILSGFYNIVGFKHVLTTTGNKAAYSEFVLRKNLDFGSIN